MWAEKFVFRCCCCGKDNGSSCQQPMYIGCAGRGPNPRRRSSGMKIIGHYIFSSSSSSIYSEKLCIDHLFDPDKINELVICQIFSVDLNCLVYCKYLSCKVHQVRLDSSEIPGVPTSFGKQKKSNEMRRNSSKCVYILARQYRSHFNLTKTMDSMNNGT